MAEVEFAVLADQCLDRRLPDQNRVRREVGVWEAGRNAANATVHWQFTTDKARSIRRIGRPMRRTVSPTLDEGCVSDGGTRALRIPQDHVGMMWMIAVVGGILTRPCATNAFAPPQGGIV
jgi:hypothetical protein